MARSALRLLRSVAAAVAAACAAHAFAQSAATVTITGRSAASPAALAGFADTPLVRLPLQATAFGAAQLADNGVRSIGGLTALDASVGDAYNAEGYWSIVSVRGYTLDNRFNYRRNGLPINAETAIGLDNKERVELVKGISGMQAGTSAPGGLVNLVTKHANGPLRSLRVEAREAGTLLAAVDLAERFGSEGAVGVRLNAAVERLDPRVRHTQGERWLAALATDWRIAPGTLVQAELEASHQRQPSVVGFSLLGDTVPDPRRIDPRLNLNNQAWRQPVVMDGLTASLRLQQRLSADWSFTAQAMQQRLKSDDRTAFPYGVYDPSSYKCQQWCDRFAPDGSFTYWQYISDNERRTSGALSVAFNGKLRAAGLDHEVEAGVLLTRYRGRFQDQVFDIAGSGNIDGSATTPASPGGTDANTNRDESSSELFARDTVQLAPQWQLWAGVRRTGLKRQSVRTSPVVDGLTPVSYEQSFALTSYAQSFATPWLGLSHELAPRTVLYASWGQGLESDVAPNRARYVNRGQPLPTLKSRQSEVGLKHESERFDAGVALFDISRPLAADVGACDAADSCTRQIDGSQRHRGVEVSGTWRTASWTWQTSAMWLNAQRRGATAQPENNGQRPVNVPQTSLRAAGEYRIDSVPGLALQARWTAEGDRHALPYDPTLRIPGWSRIDLGARWRQTDGATTKLWRLGVDNATDRRAWKESPYQFGHAYLYPLAPRTWRASVQLTL